MRIKTEIVVSDMLEIRTTNNGADGRPVSILISLAEADRLGEEIRLFIQAARKEEGE